MRFERGFKSWCENTSVQIRRSLGAGPTDPLSPVELADHLDVRLIAADDVPGLSEMALTTLLTSEADNWSAVTISHGSHDVVIYNSTHSRRRRSSDLMHELAHLLMRHDPSKMFFSTDRPFALRSYNQDQEEEANWLAGCLLLPRPALLAISRARIGHESVCSRYEVSKDMLTYRLNVSGVNTQMNRRRRSSARS